MAIKKPRRKPSHAIGWREFMKTDYKGRDIRCMMSEPGETPIVFRGPIDGKKTIVEDAMVSVPTEWMAKMFLDGKLGGVWRRCRPGDHIAFYLGNRPRLLPDGRILILKHRHLQIDILPEGDNLTRSEVES